MKYVHLFMLMLIMGPNMMAKPRYGYIHKDLPSKITGRIIDKKTGSPLPGASINIPEVQNGAIADGNGFYELDHVPARKYVVVVSFIGYTTLTQEVDFASQGTLNFYLETTATEAKEVIVTGVGRATQIARNPVPALIVTKQYLLERAGSTNIIDAISNLPGVNAVTTGPNVSKPFIRGLGYNRVLTLVDGVRQEGQQWGDEHGVEVDQNAVDRVEVIKGPASLIYGSDAIAGVVNLIPPSPVQDGKILGSISGNYQTNMGLLGTSARIQGNQHGLVWTGILSYKMAKDYQNSHDGRVYGTGYRETDARFMIGLNRTWGYSFLNGSLFDDTQEIPDGSRDSITRQFTEQVSEADTYRPIVSYSVLNSYQITPIHQHIQHYRIYDQSNILLGEGNLKFSVGYQFNHRREYSHPELDDVPGLNLHLHTLTYDIKYNYNTPKDFEWTFGINGMYQKNDIHNSTDFIIPAYHLFDFGPFVFLKKDWNGFSFSGGIRYDSRSLESQEAFKSINPVTLFDYQVFNQDTLSGQRIFSSGKYNFSGLSGSLGISYELSKSVNIKGDISRGFRSPNISELSDNGIHPGTFSYQIGNSSFKPEFSFQEDIGFFWASDIFSGSLEFFHNSIQNYIYNQKLQSKKGGDSIIVSGVPTYKFQQTGAEIQGGEILIDLHPLHNLHFSNSLSLTYGSNTGQVPDSLKYLPFIPPLHSHSELKLDLKNVLQIWSKVYLSLGLDHYEPQYRFFKAYGTETATGGYNLISAGLGGTLSKANGKPFMNLYVEGTNLADIAYQSHLSRLKYFDNTNLPPGTKPGIFNLGRNISIKAVFPLYFKD